MRRTFFAARAAPSYLDFYTGSAPGSAPEAPGSAPFLPEALLKPHFRTLVFVDSGGAGAGGKFSFYKIKKGDMEFSQLQGRI